MKRFIIRPLALLSYCWLAGVAPAADMVRIAEDVPAGAIQVSASSQFSTAQAVQNLVNGSGFSADRHDDQGSAQTMWHSTEKPAPTRPAPGLPESPAWVRFDFPQPAAFDEVRVWNHNQANFTDRGFRKAQLFTTTDGTTWKSAALEIPRGTGTPDQPCSLAVQVGPGPFKAAVLAAESNYGSAYWGLSEVRFVSHREVAAADLPVPTGMTASALPYYRYRTDGQAGRELTITLQGAKIYGEAIFEVDCAGTLESTRFPANPQGADRFTLLLPAGSGATNARETVVALLSGRTTLRATLAVAPCPQRTYYVLMHSHVDIGYTDIQPRIAARQAQNVVHALDLIDATRDFPKGAQFKWNVEVFWQVEQFYKIATPEQKQRFEQAVRDGRIGIDALYGNLLTGLARGEELVRQTEFATDLGRRCGVTIDTMMISDVPGLIWGIVPALAQAGVKYISDGPNAARGMIGDRIGYVRERWENHPFRWLSPSGKESAIYWGAQGGYSIGHHFGPILAAVAELEQQLGKLGYPYDIVQLRWTKGDNGGPDEGVMPAVRDWNATHAWPKLIIATTSEMFHEFDKQYGAQLPVFRGDLTPYWEDGAGSSARETGLSRLASDRMTQAETLWTLLSPATVPADRVAEVLKNVAMYSEHTWGAYNSISQPDLAFVKDQWKHKQAFALDADAQSRKLLDDALATRGAAAAPATAVDVFNTASWPRTDLVILPAEMALAPGDAVRDDAGQPVPSQRLADGRLAFLARAIPALGGRRFTLTAGAPAPGGSARASGLELSSSAFLLKLDEASGDIVSLRRAGSTNEFADLRGGVGLNSYFYLPGGNVKDAKRSGTTTISVKEKGPLVASLLVESEAPGCRKLTREVRLVDGLDRIELLNLVDKLPVRAVEGVHFGFAFAIPDGVMRMSIPWGVIQPEVDQLPGACRNWFSVERWVDVANEQLGISWATLEAPLVEVGGLTANLPRGQPNPRAYLAKIEPSQTLYSWAMNNHWHTNYRAEQEGPTWFRYALRPHGPYDAVASAQFGVEATEPLIVAPAAGYVPAGSRVRVEPAAVQITSLKPGRDGRSLIVRLYNPTAQAAQAQLTWAPPVPHALMLSDALESTGAKIASTVEVAAGGVVTVRAEMPPAL